MKKLIEIVDGEGLEKLIGQRITVFCSNYIYTGNLVGVNQDDILLENPGIVYETGPFDEKKWKDMQSLPSPWYIRVTSIESYGVLK